jgi:hypothetical protein
MERIADDLHKEEWRFWFDDNTKTLYLDTYVVWERETKRKGWHMVKSYSRLPNRNPMIPLEDVPFDDTIKAEALMEFTRNITVKTWVRR